MRRDGVVQVQFSDLIFCYDFSRLTADGLLYDYGPYELHATPGAAGAAPTRQLDGSYSLDGGDYWALSGAVQTRFYSVAPTGTHTYLLVSYKESTGNSQMPFSCSNSGAGGVYYGITLQLGTSGTIAAYQFKGDGTTPVAATTNAVQPYGMKVGACLTVETTPRGMMRQKYEPATWAVGAFGTGAYDAAITPRIGMHPNGNNPMLGRMWYLALLRGAVSSADLAELSSMLAVGVKPWAVR